MVAPLALAVLALALFALGPARASAATPSTTESPPKAKSSKNCAKAIVDDWYPDGRVDFLYPIACYSQAIKSLPADLRGYASAEADILRAQQFAKQNKPDPGRVGTSPTETETSAPETTTDPAFGGSAGGSAGGPNSGGGEKTVASQTVAAPEGASADSSSVPVPLIVLGGLAVLLLAAGGAGYMSRRMRGDGGPVDGPPAGP